MFKVIILFNCDKWDGDGFVIFTAKMSSWTFGGTLHKLRLI